MSTVAKTKAGERIVVAMSGGVDSCATALLLCDQGYEVIGISMQVWDYRKNGGSSSRATCCAPADFEDAREIADARAFPFYVFDFEDSFYKEVIQPFMNSYIEGKTPNPCLDCNRKVKFRELRERARALGADKVATGHYAQIKLKPNGLFGLFTSVDTEKDQSYFLYALNQEDLSSTLFPVGNMHKSEVRAYLSAQGFNMASKQESQDICFVSSSVSEFIKKHSGKDIAPGKFVSEKGDILGEHEGVHKFTIGQRKGLGLSEKFPLYVIDIDASQNLVKVGPKDALERKEFFVTDVSWISGIVPKTTITTRVKLRYRHPGVICSVEPVSNNTAKVTFLEDWTAVSPGQAAVFYNEQPESDGSVEVIGGGRIAA